MITTDAMIARALGVSVYRVWRAIDRGAPHQQIPSARRSRVVSIDLRAWNQWARAKDPALEFKEVENVGSAQAR